MFSMITALRCLRPYLHLPLSSRAPFSSYLCLSSLAKSSSDPVYKYINPVERAGFEKVPVTRHEGSQELWPRIKSHSAALHCRTFRERYRGVQRGETRSSEKVVIRGRIWSFRTAGNKLAFIDVFQDHFILQCVCNFNEFAELEVTPAQFRAFLANLRRGDVYNFIGSPHRTNRTELSLLVTSLPQILSRCIQPLPTELKNEESRIRNRHVDLLVHRKSSDVIRLRSEILQFLRQFLIEDGHLEVQTPILADAAGGAVARPFYTSATEFEERQVALRIAPELWLKRLIMGGLERVFEIGPSFRNEGIDLSHNPEFWTCEFYRTYTDLEELIAMTENIFRRLSMKVNILQKFDHEAPYPRLDFISAIEAELKCKLPDLTSPEAESQVAQLMQDRYVTLPASPTLPRLLDKLSSEYLEPQCYAPTWIINHPECLSPLSKSFYHPNNQQRVSARAELFINKQELVNTYEEENSPFEQRRKFEMQLRYNDAENSATSIDESYLQALEWGMPPTGGWGCGIDRLCMLFGGTDRIADTLSFGTLRNVVALGGHEKKASSNSATGQHNQKSNTDEIIETSQNAAL